MAHLKFNWRNNVVRPKVVFWGESKVELVVKKGTINLTEIIFTIFGTWIGEYLLAFTFCVRLFNRNFWIMLIEISYPINEQSRIDLKKSSNWQKLMSCPSKQMMTSEIMFGQLDCAFGSIFRWIYSGCVAKVQRYLLLCNIHTNKQHKDGFTLNLHVL